MDPHGILISAKISQTMVDEIFQCPQRLFSCDGPPEVFHRSRMIGALALNPLKDFLRNRIGHETGRLPKVLRPLFSKAPAIGGVVIPLASFRFSSAVDEYLLGFSYLPIKIFQPPLLALTGPGFKKGSIGQKVRVFDPVQCDPKLSTGRSPWPP